MLQKCFTQKNMILEFIPSVLYTKRQLFAANILLGYFEEQKKNRGLCLHGKITFWLPRGIVYCVYNIKMVGSSKKWAKYA